MMYKVKGCVLFEFETVIEANSEDEAAAFIESEDPYKLAGVENKVRPKRGYEPLIEVDWCDSSAEVVGGVT